MVDGQAGEKPELDLDEFLRLLPHLEPADLMAISAAYQQADPGPRDTARVAASGAAKQRKLAGELDRLQGSIIQWAGASISPSSAFTLEGLQTNPMLGDVRRQAVPALLDAAAALLLRDGLSNEDRAALMDPLGAAIG